MVNLSMIKSQHRAWMKKLEAYLKDNNTLNEIEAFSHEDCDLGRWIYREGMVKYGHVPEMQELEEIHVESHSLIRKIMQQKQDGKIISIKELERLNLINRKIISLLTDIEQRLNK